MKKVSLLVGVSLMLLPFGLGASAAGAAEVDSVTTPETEEVEIIEVEGVDDGDIEFEDVVESDAEDVEMPDAVEITELTPEEPVEPGGRLTRGTKIPTSRHNINSKRYDVSGSGYGGVLYSNKLLYGVKKYKISMTNYGSKTANIQFKTKTSTAKTMNVAKGKNVSATVTVKSASTNYYLRITGGHYNIRGWVKK